MRSAPLLAALLTIAAGPVGSDDEPIEPASRPSRRSRIHDLHRRTGWQLSVCRRLVDTKTEAEIEAMVREHDAKEGSERR